MNLKKWGYLFWTTLLVGAIASMLTGFYLLVTDPGMSAPDGSKFFDVIVYLLFNIGIGLMYSVFAQMGFFAYLTVNYIAKSTIKRKPYWTTLQWIIILIVFFDVIYLRYTRFEGLNHGILGYSVLPVVLFIIAVFIAIWKSKLTNASAFTPTVFFIFAISILEIIPALRENIVSTTILMTVPIVCCNIWQIMKLHTLLQPEKS